MQFEWLGKITYTQGLEAQSARFEGCERPFLLGFETTQPTVTLGRSTQISSEVINSEGLLILPTDRGGQATLHSPGQLVLFPVLPKLSLQTIRPRDLICQLLRDLHLRLKQHYSVLIENRGDGLYTANGKLAFIGLRLSREGVRHGLALNVSNDLAEFQKIRSCGIAGAPHDQIFHYDRKADPEQVFRRLSSTSCDLTHDSAQV